MRKLSTLRLINWYHFVDHTFAFDGSCLVFGDNGSGKSTVLDAIQWALVADQSQVRFNKAANENSRRTLHGYIRHKLGSEDEERPGQLKYGRQSATSHVALAFTDDDDPRASFCCGVVMEASESDARVERAHWVRPGADLSWLPALDGPYVRTRREFVNELRADEAVRVYNDGRTYREEVRHRLGPLPESFHRLLVKSLDFKPIGKVKDFVFHYLLDDKPLDTAALQANIEHYKRLEAEARAAERRIESLSEVVALGERVEGERHIERSHLFVALRARLELERSQLALHVGDRDRKATRRNEADVEIERTEREIGFLREQRDQVVGVLQNSATAQMIGDLERRLDRARDDLRRAGDADKQARAILGRQTGLLDRVLSAPARDVRRAHPELIEDGSLVGAAAAPDIVMRLHDGLRADGALGGRDVRTWEGRVAKLYEDLTVARTRADQAIAKCKDEAAELTKERRDLEAGRARYPKEAEALLHLLKSKLRGSGEARPLAELIEVPAERWRNAVEGYLNTRRFDVIVDPADFQRALGLYERHKHAYPLPGRGAVFISRVGLVDVEKVVAAEPRRDERSLAARVTTEDPNVRAYVDFIMGDVICVDSERSLRDHRRAITDTVMTYQNHAARQTPKNVYERHYVGRASIARRLEQIDARLGELHHTVVRLGQAQAWLQQAEKEARTALGEVRLLSELVASATELPNLQLEVAQLSKRLANIDRSEIAGLEAERDDLAHRISAADRRLRELIHERGELDGTIRYLAETIARCESASQLALQAVDSHVAPEDETRVVLEGRYDKIRSAEPVAEIEGKYRLQHERQRGRVENLIRRLVKLKADHVNVFGMIVEDDADDAYGEFVTDLESWQQSRLPDYLERIGDAKKHAIEQLTEDVIFRLRENLQSVRRQIDELNRALKDVPFGSERYQFVLEIDDAHRAFYDLVIEAGSFERDSLFGQAALANPEAQRTLEGLFERLVSGRAHEVREELAERADYREYYRYDLRIMHADGTHSFYDRVAADKSGGETQTPYYVAILASMYRVYRATSLHGRPAAGLVVLDEAFSKMDESRIKATLDLARGLGLQLVMATPKERSELVAPHVETSLYIHKDPMSGAPTVLDFTKEFAADAAGATREAHAS